WQRWARAWHEALVAKYGDRYAVDPRRTLLAKTDYGGKEHCELQKTLGIARPWHACEGTVLASKLVLTIFRNQATDQGIEPKYLAPLAVAVRSAIARHHTSQAEQCKNARLASGANEAVVQALDLLRSTDTWRYDSSLLLPSCREGT